MNQDKCGFIYYIFLVTGFLKEKKIITTKSINHPTYHTCEMTKFEQTLT